MHVHLTYNSPEMLVQQQPILHIMQSLTSFWSSFLCS